MENNKSSMHFIHEIKDKGLRRKIVTLDPG